MKSVAVRCGATESEDYFFFFLIGQLTLIWRINCCLFIRSAPQIELDIHQSPIMWGEYVAYYLVMPKLLRTSESVWEGGVERS